MNISSISKKIVVAGTLIIWTIKYIIRPNYVTAEPLKFLLGISPNFIGSFLIPFGACWFFGNKNHLLARAFQINSSNELKKVCLTGMGMLIINEYLQQIPFFGRTFDYFDMLFSAIGLFISYLVFAKMQKEVKKQYV